MSTKQALTNNICAGVGVYWTAAREFSLASCRLRKPSIAEHVIMIQQFDSNHKLHSYNNNEKNLFCLVASQFSDRSQETDTSLFSSREKSIPATLIFSSSRLVLCSVTCLAVQKKKKNTLKPAGEVGLFYLLILERDEAPSMLSVSSGWSF